jgi:hypothetical protein
VDLSHLRLRAVYLQPTIRGTTHNYYK